MVRRQKNASIGQDVFGAVAEFVLALAGDQFSSLQVVEIGFESDSSERNDDAQIFESFQFALQIRSAVSQFLGQRLVVRRRATGGGGYIETSQHLSIVTSGRSGQRGESRLVQ